MELNGNAVKTDEGVGDVLLGPALTGGYQPSIPALTFWLPDGTPNIYVYRDLEPMLTHPHVVQTLGYYKSGITGAEFDVKANSSEVGEFVLSQTKRFWDRAIPVVQHSYEYGWLGAEIIYAEERGDIVFDMLKDFAARDTFVLTINNQYVGVRIKHVEGQGNIDLWGPRWTGDDDDHALDRIHHVGENAHEPWMGGVVPAKGFWYAHNPRWSLWYGRTQLLGAWRPWRRLAGVDGAETVIDGGIYRFAYQGPMIFFPPEDFKRANVAQGQSVFEYARDKAREMAEQAKAGMSSAFPSTQYPPEQGGGKKWDMKWPDKVITVDPLINYAKYLKDEISFGIGVPPEIMQAAETGSGYSGRRIPMETFFAEQQVNANLICRAWDEQGLRALVFWKFGPDAWYELTVKSLLKTKTMDSQKEGSPPAPVAGEQQPPGQGEDAPQSGEGEEPLPFE
jgi:hypothetical protein